MISLAETMWGGFSLSAVTYAIAGKRNRATTSLEHRDFLCLRRGLAAERIMLSFCPCVRDDHIQKM